MNQSIKGQRDIWCDLRSEVLGYAESEPILRLYLNATILDHDTLEYSLSYLLANKLSSIDIAASSMRELITQVISNSLHIRESIRSDLSVSAERDPAARGIVNPYLNHKGFHALQAYRIANYLWLEKRYALAFHMQSRISEVFAVDIHPAATIGKGVFLDHGTGIVIGETTVVGDNVSILQGVTLGGTGKEGGDRHPKIERGVLICAGAKILGNIRVGIGAKVGAGSVVLNEVAPHTTVVGVPAKTVGRPKMSEPGLSMDQQIDNDENTESSEKKRYAC